jgi:hypothetical protein
MLTDHTQPIYRDRIRHESERPQIIYMTADGKDYCREPATGLDGSATHERACQWAQTFFSNTACPIARRAVTGFRIEWW